MRLRRWAAPGALCTGWKCVKDQQQNISYLNSLVNLNQRDAFWSLDRTHTRENRTRHTTNSTTTRQTGTHERTPDNAYFGHDFGFLVLVLDPLIAAETP